MHVVNDQAQQYSKAELKARYRLCWSPKCKNKAFLQDWAGWEWCLKHWYRSLRRGTDYHWFYFRKTKIF